MEIDAGAAWPALVFPFMIQQRLKETTVEIVVAGAGIGGLTAALKLHRLGLPVTVVDAARELRPLGVGINLLPHGAGILYELGLGDGLEATGIQTRAVEYRTEFGQLILSDPRGRNAGSPWPQYSIHRGYLHKLLLDAVIAELPPGRVITDRRVEGFEQTEKEGVRVRLRSSDGSRSEILTGVLIGADGIHSAICRQLHPHAAGLAFSGTMMWRTAVEAEPFLGGETMVIAGHHDRKAVIYPISREAFERGRSLINLTMELHIGKEAHYLPEDWNRSASIDEFIDRFESFRFDFIDLPALLRQSRSVFVYPMVDRDPLPHWSVGTVTLLGDAAHPMYPIGANGASQAILDADALGKAFEEAGAADPMGALRLYEERRLPATAKVVASNRGKGPEAVLQLARERIKGPDDDVSALISREEIDAITVGYQKVAGFDSATLAGRAANAPKPVQ
jgi:2-polyprenyl-6-methoxyphenol hydroxylase-like FAD-dependent oxidoreductase